MTKRPLRASPPRAVSCLETRAAEVQDGIVCIAPCAASFQVPATCSKHLQAFLAKLLELFLTSFVVVRLEGQGTHVLSQCVPRKVAL